MKILEDIVIEPNEADFKAVITKLKSSKSKYVFLNVMFGRYGLFCKQAKAQGFTPLYTANTVIENKKDIETSAGCLDGTWYPQIAEASHDFISKFLENYPGTSTYAVAQCYDLLGILNQAATIYEHNQNIVESLKKVSSYSGVSGEIKLRADNVFEFSSSIKQIRNGNFEVLK